MKKRNIKKIAIVSGTIGAVAITPIYPAITISAFTIAAYTVPGILVGKAVENEKWEQEKNVVSKPKTLTYKKDRL